MNNNFDSPRLEGMEKFLKRIHLIFSIIDEKEIENPNMVVYSELCRDGLKKEDMLDDGELISNEEFFPIWGDIFKEMTTKNFDLVKYYSYSKQDLELYFFFFQNFRIGERKKFIKLYIPVDYQNLKDAVCELIEFLIQSQIRHESKVSKELRSDNIVVRVGIEDVKSAKKIIDFCNSNPIIKKGLNQVNPFVPSINGIGYMRESGISYNEEMANIILKYVKFCIKENKEPTIKEFYEYFKNNIDSEEVKEIFEIAYKGKSELDANKQRLLLDALKATFNEYGLEKTVFALTNIVKNNDYSSISNNNPNYKYRDLLSNYVSNEEIFDYIKLVLKTSENIRDFSDIDLAISNFCNLMFEDVFFLKLDEILTDIYKKDGVAGLYDMINNFDLNIYKNLISESDYKKYSDNYLPFFAEAIPLEAMVKALQLKGIYYTKDYDEVIKNDDIIELYASIKSETKYIDSEEDLIKTKK